MFKFVKKMRDHLKNMNNKDKYRAAVKKKSDICDRIISGESFFDERRQVTRRVEFERRRTA